MEQINLLLLNANVANEMGDREGVATILAEIRRIVEDNLL